MVKKKTIMNEDDLKSLDVLTDISSKFVVAAWFLGLAYFYWFNESVPTLGIITNILLVVIGMFASSIIFGMGFNAIGRLIAKIMTGKWESMPSLSLIMGIISSIVTFFSVKYIILFLT